MKKLIADIMRRKKIIETFFLLVKFFKINHFGMKPNKGGIPAIDNIINNILYLTILDWGFVNIKLLYLLKNLIIIHMIRE